MYKITHTYTRTHTHTYTHTHIYEINQSIDTIKYAKIFNYVSIYSPRSRLLPSYAYCLRPVPNDNTPHNHQHSINPLQILLPFRDVCTP